MRKETPAGSTAIDFGTGAGFFAFHLLDLVGPRGSVVAIDNSSAMLRLVTETARVTSRRNLRALRADTDFGDQFAPRSVHVVSAIGLGLTCSEVKEFVASCARVLVPKGVVLLDISPTFHRRDGRSACKARATETLFRAGGFARIPSANAPDPARTGLPLRVYRRR